MAKKDSEKVLVIATAFQLWDGRGVTAGSPMEVSAQEAADLIALRRARRAKPQEAKRLKAEGATDVEQPQSERGSRNRYLRRDLRVKE